MSSINTTMVDSRVLKPLPLEPQKRGSLYAKEWN